MTIEQLGSIGELVAAVATIATLGYLAVQIRASAGAVRAEGRRSRQNMTISVNGVIANDENVSRIFRSGLANPQSLDREERFRFRFLFVQFLMLLEAVWQEDQNGTADAGELDSMVQRIKTLLLTPGGRHVWAQQQPQHPPEFQRFVAVILEEQREGVAASAGGPPEEAVADQP